MEARSVLQGLQAPQEELSGSPEVCVAILDGPVDLSHPCFQGADLTRIDTLVTEAPGPGPMSLHGTLVTSLFFGQPGTVVTGIAPRCRGLLLPVFRDGHEARIPQLDLARAIERAVQEGAHIINISGGERVPDGQADELLARALQLCDDHGVLVIAAAGNDGCDCLQVPAAVPSVLAVGATDPNGTPLQISNWGAAYATHGVVAPGEAVEGAAPGGGRATVTGSSFATPLVAGVAALLVAAQLRIGRHADPKAVGNAILTTASVAVCQPPDAPACRRYLGGSLNAARAHALITATGDTAMTNLDGPTPDTSPVAPEPAETAGATADAAGATDASITLSEAGAPEGVPGSHDMTPSGQSAAVQPAPVVEQTTGVRAACGAESPANSRPPSATADMPEPGAPNTQSPPSAGDWRGPRGRSSGVRPSCGCGGSSASECQCGGGASTGPQRQLIYAIGTLGFDYQTEARRDTFTQQMKNPVYRQGDTDVEAPANPQDGRQLADYLAENPWVSDKVTWTLNLDATPVYALEAETPVAMDWNERIDVDVDGENVAQELRTLLKNLAHPPVSIIYRTFRDVLRGQMLNDNERDYVSRVSIPGVLTGRTTRLYSGQVVPVVEVKSRGLCAWNEARLVESILGAVNTAATNYEESALPDNEVRDHVKTFLGKVYHQFRNLGQSSADRALNFAGTNGFLFGSVVKEGLLAPGITHRARRADGTFEQPRLGALDTIRVSKSPHCRPGSDCQDVFVSFFDPENDQRAKYVYQFTFDVSDELPVSLAPVHQFLDR
ncbi:S8 family serine peptidase [Streptomyces hokutonensis]|uniref:cyanobactin maturation protease PatG family protein n=1 Tax=Streptomyces hokutonensis TaxID=1306990 RepID=UPI0004756B40|nr:S8 family serine peptidase [Streptomyces hokutonensis]